jgi:hypothetical protein
MGAVAFLLASLGVVAVAVPGPGKLAAIALGTIAVGWGLLAYRRRENRASRRLAGAAGVAVGSLAIGLGAAKVALTLIALARLETLLR